MAEQFDPYYEWLGIPPKDQPPHHYRLLGIEVFESNPNVIEHAADRQMAHIRTLQSGKRSAESQQLLNEISAAKVCLLNADRRLAYDRELREQQSVEERAAIPEPPAQPDVVVAQPQVAGSHTRAARAAKKPSQIGMIMAVVAVCVVAIAGVAFVLTRGSGEPDEVVKGKDKKSLPDAKKKTNKGNGATKGKKAKGQADVDRGKGTAKAKLKSTPKTKKKKTTNTVGTTGKQRSTNTKGQTKQPLPTISQQQTRITRPVPAALKQQVETAMGMVDDKFAICQTMSFDEFRVVAQELGQYGYRPIRCRPYRGVNGLRVAAIWQRDGQPWAMTLAASPGAVQRRDERFRGRGMWPVDVAGYTRQTTRFMAIWGKLANPPTDSKIYVGESWRGIGSKLKDEVSGYVPQTRQDFVSKSGRRLTNQVWYVRSKQKGMTGTLNKTGFGRSSITSYYPNDVCIQPWRSPDNINLYMTCGWEDKVTPFRTVFGIRAKQLTTVARILGSDGFIPQSISVIRRNRVLHFAAVWKWPHGVAVPANLVRKHSNRPPNGVAFTAGFSAPRTPTTKKPLTGSPFVAVKKNPVPAADELAKALQQVEGVFKVAKAKTLAQKLSVAEELYRQSAEEADYPTLYVLLTTAGRLYAESERLPMAMRVADETGRKFAIDVLAVKANYLKKLNLAKNQSVRMSVAQAAQEVAEECVKSNRFDTAIELCKIAHASWRRAKAGRMAAGARRRSRQITTAKKYFAAAETARQTLTTKPEDGDANLALGKYLVAVRLDFETGLPILAKGSDAKLADLAKRDGTDPTAGEAQMALGDAWYKWATSAKSIDQVAGYARARHWYNECYSKVSTVLQRKVDKQLLILDAKVPGSTGERKLPWLDKAREGVVRYFDAHTSRVNAVAASRRGRIMVTGGEQKQIFVWELSTGRRLMQLPCDIERVSAVVITPDNRYAFAGGDRNKGIRIWELRKGRPTGVIATTIDVKALALSANGRRLLCGMDDSKGTMAVIDVSTRRARGVFQSGRSIRKVAMTPNGQIGAVCGYRHLQLWDLANGRLAKNLTGHSRSTVTAVALSPDGQRAASVDGRELRIWDVTKGTSEHRYRIYGGSAVAFSPDSKKLVVGNYSSELLIFDVETGTLSRTLKEKSSATNVINSVTFLCDPRGVITSSSDNRVRLWRLP